MTRAEIGSYLGMKLETVSRTFSKFAAAGIIEVRQRHVRILNAPELQRIVNQQSGQESARSNRRMAMMSGRGPADSSKPACRARAAMPAFSGRHCPTISAVPRSRR